MSYGAVDKDYGFDEEEEIHIQSPPNSSPSKSGNFFTLAIMAAVAVSTILFLYSGSFSFPSTGSNLKTTMLKKSITTEITEADSIHGSGVDVDSDSMITPLYLLDTSTSVESVDLIERFFTKYGMDLAIENTRLHETKAEGWIYSTVYSAKGCEGTVYSVGAMRMGTCIPFQNPHSNSSGGFVADCDDGEVVFTSYNDTSCSYEPQRSKVVATVGGCKSIDCPDTEKYFAKYTCQSSPVLTFSGSYNVFTVAYDSNHTCDDSIVAEALPLETCLPLINHNQGNESVKFLHDSNDPMVKYFDSNDACEGVATTVEVLSTSCHEKEDYGEAQTLYKWYYHAEETKSHNKYF